MSKKNDIKVIREKLGLTQEDMAARLGVSWPTVQRWESGKNKPSKSNLIRIKKIEEEIKCKEKIVKKKDEVSPINERCPSCFGAIENNKCRECGAVKIQSGKYVPPDNIKEKGDKKKKMEEKEKIKQGENKISKYVWAPGILYSYICECGTEVEVEKNTQTSFWDDIEWVVCPNCDERRRKENLIREARKYGR